ncbi:preprotein translocase subunit SecE [Methylopila sp. 73B]|jgi:preprotein translocase subunit SecE|uniref:preprotein translocase subunit SecE n=1 Tax=Methylopila sp. 73B TaxID=1120792 RepID=UPI00036AEBEB|nr:preprotein translocase subunit SecE [Methylopila sp. 73B]
MAKTSPVEFIQEVGAETSKVVWPTRRETTITTVMVFVFVFVASVFFFFADMILRTVVTLILGIGQ